MDFTVAIVLYILILTMLLAITWSMGIHIFSAITVSLLLAGIFLLLLVPPADINRYTNNMIDGYDCGETTNHLAMVLFAIIYIITLLFIIWYILCKTNDDTDVHNSISYVLNH